MIPAKIRYDADYMDYTLYPDGVRFTDRDEAEFYYISRYHDDRISDYSDYKIKYNDTDGETLDGVFLDDKKILAAYHFKQLKKRPTREDINLFYARYFHTIPDDESIFTLITRCCIY